MKNLKRFLIALIVTVLICTCVLFPLSFLGSLGSHNAEERYLNEWYQVKDRYAQETKEPKLIIFAGSNVLFGVDTQRMQKELNYPVMNAGVHAAMHEYDFYWAKKIIHEGDTVIMPLEYTFYETNGFYQEYLSYIRSYDPGYLDTFSMKSKLKFMLKCNETDLLKDDIQQIIPFRQTDSGYNGKYLNYNGDMTNNKVKDSLSEQDLRGMMSASPFTQAQIPSSESIKEITDFVQECQKKNVTVYAAWPSYLYSQKSFSAEDEKKIQNIIDFYTSLGVKVIGNYQDELYDLQDFYDTNYHLNARGKKKRTDHLIDLIRQNNIIPQQ